MTFLLYITVAITIWLTYPDGSIVEEPLKIGDKIIAHVSFILDEKSRACKNIEMNLSLGDDKFVLTDDEMCPGDVKTMSSLPHAITKNDLIRSSYIAPVADFYVNNSIEHSNWGYWKVEE